MSSSVLLDAVVAVLLASLQHVVAGVCSCAAPDCVLWGKLYSCALSKSCSDLTAGMNSLIARLMRDTGCTALANNRSFAGMNTAACCHRNVSNVSIGSPRVFVCSTV